MLVTNGYVSKKAYSRIKPYIATLVDRIVENIDSLTGIFTYDLPKPHRGRGEQVFNAFTKYMPYTYLLKNSRIDDFMDYDYCKTYGRVKFNAPVIRELLKVNKQIDIALSEMVSSLELSKKTDIFKVRAIHDFVCEKMHYCHEKVGENGLKHLMPTIQDLVFGDCCVCSGYSILFHLLCEKAGIECDNVCNNDHEWNRVKIDGRWLFVDVTWDDGDTYKDKWLLRTRSEFYTELGHPKAKRVCTGYWKL